MEANPPSYRQATAVNAWDIVADYISSSDLCAVALVCRTWHTIFIPHLWGNPASHFGDENDRVYVALTRFKRTLPWARLAVRSLTHTLHLPPAHAEIYNGPHADWLREVLEGLPNLQSLIVRGLPFFDHAALNALKYTRPSGQVNGLVPAQTPFGLRLLDASRCGNVTASGLHQALRRFDSLLYLDLSWTYPARDPQVLRTLGQFPDLQVLKLRGVSLRDEDVEILAGTIRTRVRSLDVRNNHLTDRSVRILLQKCFTLPPQQRDGENVSSPSLLPYLGAEMLAIYRGEQFEAYLRNEFTAKFVGRLAIEDAPESGITHLYIADNQLTVEGLSGLLRSGRLHVLDAGSVAPELNRHPTLGFEDDPAKMVFPGIEKLTPVIVESASHSLTYLRIDHSLITKEPLNYNEEEIVPGICELADTSGCPAGAAELDGGAEIYELQGDNTPRAELPADPIHIVISQATDENPNVEVPEYAERREARRSSVDAPEPVNCEALADCSLHVVSVEQVDDVSRVATSPNPTTTSDLPSRGRGRSYSSVVSERKSRVKTHVTQSKGFHPGILPHLTTLVLTGVPASSPTPETSKRLIAYIRECAQETSLARLQSRLDWTLPPGRRGSHNRRELGREVFALEQVVLEVAPERPDQRRGKASAWRHQGTRSVTQDNDSEALWSAAESDFSFFGEGEVCSLQSSLEPERPPLSIMSGMEVVASSQAPVPRPPKQENNDTGLKTDVIAEMSRFRRSRKSAYEARLAAGDTDPEVDGFWDGNIKVIRRARDFDPKHEDDEVWADYYGNRFSNGYLYR